MSISTICTDFSVKDFVKKSCTDQYDLDELDQLADVISKETCGSISHNSALNMLSRYANIKNDLIVFNPDRRNPDQNYADLKAKINSGSLKIADTMKKTDIIKIESFEKSNTIIKATNNTNSIKKSSENTITVTNSQNKNKGFGNFNQLKK